MTDLPAAILAAEERIRAYVRETPLIDSAALSDAVGARVWLKLENLQRTGSFKLRGATNKLLSLGGAERARGVVAASSGNHGAAVAHAGKALGIGVSVFVPEGASVVKLDAMRRAGAEVVTFGTDGLDTEVRAREVAAASGRVYVSPYNDEAVVAGQGTVGVEVRRQAERLDAVVVAVGGGGLIGGIGADLRAYWPGVRIIGAQPAHSAVMGVSVRAGRVLEMASLPTLSDGTAGGIEPDAMTFELCRAVVDQWVEVPEDEIAREMKYALEVEHLLIEGAAAVAIAGLRRCAASLRGARVAVVICGGNVSAERLGKVL
ncbi:MAG TPA: threonine/serine dehydratase [Gemmatimonadaceae bacterium]|nr:threonine/serine dehydratase [Gemmatimonadaceae bacterium]